MGKERNDTFLNLWKNQGIFRLISCTQVSRNLPSTLYTFLDLIKYLIISINHEKENLRRRSVKYYDPSIPTHFLTGSVNKANILW